jgi:hypothetical protein
MLSIAAAVYSRCRRQEGGQGFDVVPTEFDPTRRV